MHYKYNTPEYRRHYKAFIQRWDESDLPDVIEPRVLEICKVVHASNQGVSIFSCEGHDEPYYVRQGYVMFAARNRKASTVLLEVLQVAMGKIYVMFGDDALGEIESNIATYAEDTLYPCVVVRSPTFETDELADRWWKVVTTLVHDQLRPYITSSPISNKAILADIQRLVNFNMNFE